MRRISSLALGVALLVAAGCGSEEAPETPAACLASASEYLAALEDAPGEVRLDGSVAISDCLVEDQPPGALGAVGRSIVEAAEQLNREARMNPSGRATVELGYLVGAVQEGESRTGGIHADLVIRLDAAARFTGDGSQSSLGAGFERAFGEGYAAGQANG